MMRVELILLLFAILQIGNGLIAYDCRDITSNVTTISIRDVAACPDPVKGYQEETRGVQIIQKNDLTKTLVRTCLLEVTRLIQTCGMFSHMSTVSSGLLTYVKPLGAEECTNIHRYKTYRTTGYTAENIKVNTTTSFSITLAGTVNSEGKCSGGTYVENSVTWTEVVVSATLQLQIKEYWASVSLDANEIHLLGGIICTYTDGYCMDAEIGETIWERGIHDKCSSSQFNILYEGIGNFITTNNTDIFAQSKFLVVEQGDRVFALTLVGKSHVCYQDAWITEHPRLLVVEAKSYGFKFKQENTHSRNADLFIYMNTKFMYVEQAFKRTVQDLYVNMIYRRCLIHRETLKNRLTLAPLSANSVSALLKNHPGYVGRVLGEVIYIMECTPKPVEIRRTTNCFHELPVRVNNESLFMAPVTHVLQEHGEEVECSQVTPPMYFIENQWVGFSPKPQVQLPPDILEVSEEPKLKFKPIQRLGTAGIYTADEIREAQRALIFGTERRAISNIITRKIIGLKTDSQGYSTVKLFNDIEIKQLAYNTVREIWGWFTELGILTSGFLGVYIILRLIKYVIGIILNGLALYETIGCGYTLVASLWNTLSIWLIHREHRRATREHQQNDASEVEQSEPNGVPNDIICEPQDDSRPYKNVVIKLQNVQSDP